MVVIPGGDRTTTLIELTLRELGIPATLSGMWYLVYAIRRTVEDPIYIRYITKRAYIDVAKHYRTTPSRVERAMRVAVRKSWVSKDAQKKLEQMGYHLLKPPTNSEYIDLIAWYIRNR